MRVTINALQEINMEPQTETEEIMQNVAMILATPKFSVPLDRGLGLQMAFLDKPAGNRGNHGRNRGRGTPRKGEGS